MGFAWGRTVTLDWSACIGIPMIPMVTRGRSALSRALAARAVTQMEIAEAAGVSQPSVSAWVSGASRPDPVQREVLRRSLAIPVSWWLTEAERMRIAATRRRRSLARAVHGVGGHARNVTRTTRSVKAARARSGRG